MRMSKCKGVLSSVAMAITGKKNGINVSNKFVRILKIFIKIYDIKKPWGHLWDLKNWRPHSHIIDD